MIVLDTDHVTLVQRQEDVQGESLRQRLNTSIDEDVRVTAISLEEQMRGWLAAIRRRSMTRDQVLFYTRLIEVTHFFASWQVLPFDEAAADQFDQLRASKVRVGSQDLKIAAICLVSGAKLLSSNLRDFQQIPGLVVEDWVHG